MSLRAMLFDLDGTLTRPLLDFPTMKREIGLPPDRFILEALEAMTPEERHRAMAIVERHEHEAAARAEMNDGAETLLAALARGGIRTGVITRNSRRSLGVVMKLHGLNFDITITREHADPKPSPAGIHVALEKLAVSPAEAAYVGDHAIDIAAGHAAGVRTIWVSNGQTIDAVPPADHTVVCPGDIVGLLDRLAES